MRINSVFQLRFLIMEKTVEICICSCDSVRWVASLLVCTQIAIMVYCLFITLSTGKPLICTVILYLAWQAGRLPASVFLCRTFCFFVCMRVCQCASVHQKRTFGVKSVCPWRHARLHFIPGLRAGLGMAGTRVI